MSGRGSEQRGLFWLSYSDLLTSLFFVMLVLFVFVFSFQANTIEKLKVSYRQLEEIERIQLALEKLDPYYFEYDKRNSRYKLKVDVRFRSNSANISDLSGSQRQDLIEAGRSIEGLMYELNKENPNVYYLLIIEGNTQRSGKNYLKIPDEGYRLSYKRALSLYNYWEESGLDLRRFDNCEVLIAGSGYFGKSREVNESENRKFTIQITPKIFDVDGMLRSGSEDSVTVGLFEGSE